MKIQLDKSVVPVKDYVIFDKSRKMWLADKGFTTSPHYVKKLSLSLAEAKVKDKAELVIEEY